MATRINDYLAMQPRERTAYDACDNKTIKALIADAAFERDAISKEPGAGDHVYVLNAMLKAASIAVEELGRLRNDDSPQRLQDQVGVPGGNAVSGWFSFGSSRFVPDEGVALSLEDLRVGLKEEGQAGNAVDVTRVEAAVARIEAAYGREKEYLLKRAETAEELAGVGLSVEMAGHDIMLLLSQAEQISRRLARMLQTTEDKAIRQKVDMLIGVLDQVVGSMKGVQILFKSSKRRRETQKIEPVLDKIHGIYESILNERRIRYRKVMAGRSPLAAANTTDGVIMQVLINLFDNAAYWLKTAEPSGREIRVTLDGDRSELIFSDSGPGIDPEYLPYVFAPFYSAKGEEGRGLGLYISRQLLERHDYRISIAEDHRKVLPGANFVVSFAKEDAPTGEKI